MKLKNRIIERPVSIACVIRAFKRIEIYLGNKICKIFPRHILYSTNKILLI